MKVQVFPLGINSKGWWSAFDFFNMSNDIHVVEVKIYQYTGSLAQTLSIQLEPMGHVFLDEPMIMKNIKEKHGRFTLVVEGPDCVYVTGLLGGKDERGGTRGVCQLHSIEPEVTLGNS